MNVNWMWKKMREHGWEVKLKITKWQRFDWYAENHPKILISIIILRLSLQRYSAVDCFTRHPTDSIHTNVSIQTYEHFRILSNVWTYTIPYIYIFRHNWAFALYFDSFSVNAQIHWNCNSTTDSSVCVSYHTYHTHIYCLAHRKTTTHEWNGIKKS